MMAATAAVAIALWVAGIWLRDGSGRQIADKATDQQVLAWVRADQNHIEAGCWLFMLGCVSFMWFAALLRDRLARYEGGTTMLSSALFGGALVTAAAAMGTMAPEIAAAINMNSITPATAGAFRQLNDAFFLIAELAAIVPVVALGAIGWRTAALPRAWAVFCFVLAVVLAIGPIGWAGLMFGVPIWMAGTTLFLLRRRSAAAAFAAPSVGTV
jgi:hypothetical protein